jgi:hypothetical protein
LSTLALQQRHQPLGLAGPPAKDQDRHVFALETYCPATDGFSAARIEKEVVVTDMQPPVAPGAGGRSS